MGAHTRTLCLLAAASLLAGPAQASVEVEGVRFAESVRIGSREVPLRGAALLRYRYVFRAYVAALYLPAGVEDPLADVPKRLEIEYFWGIPARDFARAGDALLGRNLDATTLAGLRPRLQAMNALYVDVEPGERYALTYEPGAGTVLSHDGQPLGRVPGADFAAAYFSIWLGDEPVDADLRARLLDR